MSNTELQLETPFIPSVTLWLYFQLKQHFTRMGYSRPAVSDMHLLARYCTHIPKRLLVGASIQNGTQGFVPVGPNEPRFRLFEFGPNLRNFAKSAF